MQVEGVYGGGDLVGVSCLQVLQGRAEHVLGTTPGNRNRGHNQQGSLRTLNAYYVHTVI